MLSSVSDADTSRGCGLLSSTTTVQSAAETGSTDDSDDDDDDDDDDFDEDSIGDPSPTNLYME